MAAKLGEDTPVAKGWNAKRVEANIGPSILNADLATLAHQCTHLTNNGADYLHLDIMDGHFVPNLTIGPPVVASLRKHSTAFFDLHMMVANPEQWVDDMAKAGGNCYTFHLEATKDPKSLIAMIRDTGMKVGIAIKPKTPVEDVLPLVPLVDMILIMTVEPGFGGQKFMVDMMPKVQLLRKTFPDLNIEVDGGVGEATIDTCADAGANMIVSGSAVIQAPDPKAVMHKLKLSVTRAIDARKANM